MMTEDSIQKTRAPGRDSNEAFEGPLLKLAELGLKRPPHLSSKRFLELLVDESLVSAQAVQRYVDMVQESRYADASIDEVEATAVVAELTGAIAAIDRNDPALRRLIERCEPLPPPPEPEAPKELEPEPEESLLDEQVLEEDSVPDETEHRWSRRRMGGLALFVIWSIAMIIAGSRGGEIAAWGWDELRYRFFGGVRSHGRFEQVRERAIANPDSREAWDAYAELAQRRGNWEEAAVALRHQVVRNPENPQLLNALAWFLCTAELERVRDPVEALQLAEKAYDLDQAPHITDTLAEAAFLNGDVARAVELEEDALSRIQGDNGFYRRQLQKFKAALEEERGGQGQRR